MLLSRIEVLICVPSVNVYTVLSVSLTHRGLEMTRLRYVYVVYGAEKGGLLDCFLMQMQIARSLVLWNLRFTYDIQLHTSHDLFVSADFWSVRVASSHCVIF